MKAEVFKMNIYTYLKNKTSDKVLEIVGSQMDLDDHTERTWFNPYTGSVLSNYAYIKMVINEAIDGCSKATLKDDIKIANKIVDYFRSEEEFKYIDFSFDDNGDETYTVGVTTNFGGYREYVFGLIEWDEMQQVYVLWTGTSYSDSDSGLKSSSDEGVSYSDSLQETKNDIMDEIIDSLLKGAQKNE